MPVSLIFRSVFFKACPKPGWKRVRGRSNNLAKKNQGSAGPADSTLCGPQSRVTDTATLQFVIGLTKARGRQP